MKNILLILMVFQFGSLYAQKGQDEDLILLGEHLSYDVKYSFLKVGRAELTIDSLIYYFNDKPHYFITFEIESAGLISFLYPNLRINYESYLSSDGFYPLSVTLKMDYKDSIYQINNYSYADSIYIEKQDLIKDEIRNYAFEFTPEPRRDILGTYLMIRKMDLKKINDVAKIQFYLGNRFNDFLIYPKVEIDEINGAIATIYPIEIPQVKDLPENRKSYIWLSDDNKPVKAVLGTRFGSIILNIRD